MLIDKQQTTYRQTADKEQTNNREAKDKQQTKNQIKTKLGIHFPSSQSGLNSFRRLFNIFSLGEV